MGDGPMDSEHEDHMENNPIAGKDMTQHALPFFERSVATWWRMYQTING